MGSHIDADGKFQSDKYPTCPAGKVPLSVSDTTAQDLLWRYAQRRRVVDAEFSDDLETCLRAAGFDPDRTCYYCSEPPGLDSFNGDDAGPLEPHTEDGQNEWFHALCWKEMSENECHGDEEAK